VEIDLVVSISNKEHYCIEIKSGVISDFSSFTHKAALSADIPGARFIVLSQNKTALSSRNITIYPWQEGLKKILPTK